MRNATTSLLEGKYPVLSYITPCRMAGILLHAAYHKDDVLKDLSAENLGARFIAAFADGGVNEYYSVWKRENLTNLYRLLGELTFEWGHPYPEMIFQTAALTQGRKDLENHCHLHRQGRTSLRIHKALRLFEKNKAAKDACNSEMAIKELIEPAVTSEDATSLFGSGPIGSAKLTKIVNCSSPQ